MGYKRKTKMAIQKIMGGILVVLAFWGFYQHFNIPVSVVAAALGVLFLACGKVIFEI